MNMEESGGQTDEQKERTLPHKAPESNRSQKTEKENKQRKKKTQRQIKDKEKQQKEGQDVWVTQSKICTKTFSSVNTSKTEKHLPK